jgi:hypothetical protein
MRPSLSAIVRKVLIESIADEAVSVDPPVTLIRQGREQDLEGPGGSFKRDPQSIRSLSDAEKTLAYVSQPSWKARVIRHFAFLDSHADVGDVQVRPIVLDDPTHLPSEISNPGNKQGGMGRLLVVDSDRGERLLGQIGARTGRVSSVKDTDRQLQSDITLVPIMGSAHITPVSQETLPSPWILIHSLFDNVYSLSLPQLDRVFDGVEAVVKNERAGIPKLSISALINCGWSDNVFTLIMQGRDAGSRYAFYKQMGQFASIPVGKKLKGPTTVPARPGMSTIASTVRRSTIDAVSEILTTCIVKSGGFKPHRERIKDLPDWLLKSDYDYSKGIQTAQISSQERRKFEEMLNNDLDRIEQIVNGGDVRDAMASDLVGKVIFFWIH